MAKNKKDKAKKRLKRKMRKVLKKSAERKALINLPQSSEMSSESFMSPDEQEKRVLEILGVENEQDAEVNMENIEKYFEYLNAHLTLPVLVTGIEDMGCFSWEEYYNFGPGNQKEYKALKKKYPSFRDQYELSGLDDYDEEEGILVTARRTSDKKEFVLTLQDLEAVNKNSEAAMYMQDFASWFVNY